MQIRNGKMGERNRKGNTVRDGYRNVLRGSNFFHNYLNI